MVAGPRLVTALALAEPTVAPMAVMPAVALRFERVAKSLIRRHDLRSLARLRLLPPIPALLDVSGVVPRGSLVVLRGPNGAGKSTLLAILAGVSEADRGMVQTDRSAPVAFLAAGRLGLVPRQRVAWHVQQHRQPGIPLSIADLLADVGLTGLERRRIDELSVGQQVRLAVACGLAAGCKTWLLDEVTSAVDDAGVATLLALLRRRGDTVVAAAHDGRMTAAADGLVEFDAGRTQAAPQPGPEALPVQKGTVPAGHRPLLATLWRLHALVAGATHAPSVFVQRLAVLAAAGLAAWQLAAQTEVPEHAAGLLWCGIAGLAVQVVATTEICRRFQALVRTGLDDVLRARGVPLQQLVVACLAPALVPTAVAAVGVVALAAGVAGTAIAFEATPAALAALVAAGGAALLAWAGMVLLRGSSPIALLLHATAAATGAVSATHAAGPDWLHAVGGATPAVLFTEALRGLTGLVPPADAAWGVALAWLGLGGLAAVLAGRRLRRQGSLALRSA